MPLLLVEPGVLLGARRAPVGLPLVRGLPRPVCGGAFGVGDRHYEALPSPRYHDLRELLSQEPGPGKGHRQRQGRGSRSCHGTDACAGADHRYTPGSGVSPRKLSLRAHHRYTPGSGCHQEVEKAELASAGEDLTDEAVLEMEQTPRRQRGHCRPLARLARPKSIQATAATQRNFDAVAVRIRLPSRRSGRHGT